MRGLLTDIELDLGEMKCLAEAYLREPNALLREVLKRSIVQSRERLDMLLQQLDAVAVSQAHPLECQVVESAAEPRPEPELPENCPVEPSPTAVQAAAGESGGGVSTPILAERIRTGANLRSSISLNDSFRFSREIFEGDTARMNRVLQQIGEMSSYEEATAFLATEVTFDEENDVLNDLLEALKKYFLAFN